MLRRITLLAMLAASLPGQPTRTGQMAGWIIDAANNQPVRRAVVTLTLRGTPAQWAIARTDDTGVFSFTDLPAGSYDLRAIRTELAGVWGSDDPFVPAPLLTLSDGEKRTDLTIRMIRTSSVSGVVLDSEGDPLQNAEVRLQRVAFPRGKKELVTQSVMRTDDLGRYQFSSVPPGLFYFSAGQFGSGPYVPFGTRPEIYPRVYFGGAPDWRKATPVTVRSGEKLQGVDFRLRSEQALSIQGRIVGFPVDMEPGPEGRSVNFQLQRIGDTFGPGGSFGISAGFPEYRFRVDGILPGSYKVFGTLQSGGTKYAAGQTLEVSENATDVTLTVAPVASLKGRLQVEGPGAVEIAKQRLRVALTPGEGPPYRGAPLSAQTDAEGRFVLEYVPPGVWDIGVSPQPAGTYVKAMRLGDQDVLTEEMTIGTGPTPPLQITLSTQPASVEGQVKGGPEGKRIAVLLAPSGKFGSVMSFFASALTDSKGAFRINGITPGHYRLFAFEPMAGFTDGRNPEFDLRLGKEGLELDLAEGAKAKADPQVISSEKLREAFR